MIKIETRNERRKIRHIRIRKKIKGTSERPRVSFYRSLKHIYLQAIDDTKGHTILALSTLSKELRDEIKGKTRKEIHAFLGKRFGEMLIDKGIKKIVFDRGGFKYHGNLKILCDEMRNAGVEF